jgi:hypothetical protein
MGEISRPIIRREFLRGWRAILLLREMARNYIYSEIDVVFNLDEV